MAWELPSVSLAGVPPWSFCADELVLFGLWKLCNLSVRCMPVCWLLMVGFRHWMKAASRIGRRYWSCSAIRIFLLATITLRVRVVPWYLLVWSLGAPDCRWSVSRLESVVAVMPIYELFRCSHSPRLHLYSHTTWLRWSAVLVLVWFLLLEIRALTWRLLYSRFGVWRLRSGFCTVCCCWWWIS